MLEDLRFYMMAGIYILAGVLAVAAVVASVEKILGLNQGPPRDSRH